MLPKQEQLEGKEAIDFAKLNLNNLQADGLNWEIQYEDQVRKAIEQCARTRR
jgi:hypothetical protein